ncbi:MAG: Peptide methionine sulfoxide reductase msrA [Verrucomicrobiales bacterium]|nr:Peptide methionine sulfoxide reductase msrA [Verrucomicrobiales bacterium]
MKAAPESNTNAAPAKTEFATIGGGCFWCTEAVFQALDGVKKVTSGYAGGKTENPTYEQICTGQTGHAEVIQIEFDPAKISYDKLLEVFWEAHDPTTLNRQGNDVGTQYRSVIFYHNEGQKAVAQKSKDEASGRFSKQIVTEISPMTKFYSGEAYHQDYYRRNSSKPYCSVVITPKLQKLQKAKVIPATK